MSTAAIQEKLRNVISDLAAANPAFAEGLARMMTREPRWRYYGPGWNRLKHGDRLCAYTVEPAKDERGRIRYSSWVYRVQGKHLIPAMRRDFATRRAAKARSLKLFKEEAPHA